ncbi:MAG TPA: HDIG domain-containing protein [Spirochaetota bacterium]|nr:HDIG domain-containing protein [Spirochaetota bacterium]
MDNSHIETAISIPSEEECFELFERYGMLKNIVRHSLRVRDVANALCSSLINPDSLNCSVVNAASLLHDIAKSITLKTGEHHDILGAKMLMQIGYPEIAAVVSEHVTLKNFSIDTPLREAEIVFYADKRVLHDKLVTVDERISDLFTRYGKTAVSRQHILSTQRILKELETKITHNLICTIQEALLTL